MKKVARSLVLKMTMVVVSILLVTITSTAQVSTPVRYTEAEIAIQDRFVEAKKYSLIGRYEKAEEILQNLYKENRQNEIVCLELSKIYRALEDPYNEYKYAQKAAELDPSNEHLVATHANVAMAQEKYGEAVPQFKNLVLLYPTNEEYSDKLATAYLQSNDAKKAITVYNNIEAQIGITENISRRKYEIYEILGKDKEALQELINISTANPYDVRYMHNVASFYNKMGKEDKGLEWYNRILQVDVNDAKANMALTASRVGGGDDNTYLRSLTPIIQNTSIPIDRKVLEIVPYIEQLNHSYDQELADALIMLTDKISIIHNTEAKAHAIKGDALMASGNLSGAIKAYSKTISINDNVFAVWENLMYCYEAMDDMTNLRSTATVALDLYPNQPDSYKYYGRAYASTGDISEAIEILEEGLLVSGKNIVAKSDLNAELARAYANTQNYEKAENYLTIALEVSDNKSARAFEIQGDIYQQKGDMKKATVSWKKAVSLGGQTPVLTSKLGKA